MVVNPNLQEQIPLLRDGFFESDQIALWLQPAYHVASGAILHHEALVRWRDRRNHLHLPESFFPTLARLGMLLWFDRQVIRLAIERMLQDDELCLSINLSEQTLHDSHIAEYIQELLDASEINANRLIFEITEKAIAHNFNSALSCIRSLNRMGCMVSIDNFTGHELNVLQCQQLAVDVVKIDMVKVDSQLARMLNTPTGEDLSDYLLNMRPVFGQVIIKFVEDLSTLEWTQRLGFDGVQGCYLNAPDDEPRMAPFSFPQSSAGQAAAHEDAASTDSPFTGSIAFLPFEFQIPEEGAFPELVLPAPSPITIEPLEPVSEPVLEPVVATAKPIAAPAAATIPARRRRPLPLGRIAAATTFLGLGVTALAVGGSSIAYRMTHMVVDDGVINGRTVRMRSPIDGNVTDFYARPGAAVKQGQILARVKRSRQEEQALLALKGELSAKNSQLDAAIQTLAMLNLQVQNLESRSNQIWAVETNLSSHDLSQQQATVEAATAKENAARLDYERYQRLADEGAIPRQKVEQLKAEWAVAQAGVRQANGALQAAQASLNASQSRTLMAQSPGLGNGFDQEIAQTRQQAQMQSAQIRTLTTERNAIQQRLTQAQSLFTSRQDLAVAAPVGGVVYRTERERNEQINQSEPLLTLLDCKDLWIDVMVSTYEANQIDTSKSVKVELSNGRSLTGQIDLVQPISNGGEQSRLNQIQALEPSIPPKLAGLPITRMTVRIPPLARANQSQQFCGVGELTRVTFSKRSL